MAIVRAIFVGLVAVAVYLIMKPEVKLVVEKVDDRYDYVVVGAGTAGSVVAARLSEDPDVRVLLLEAGGEYLRHSNFTIPLAGGSAMQTNTDWMYFTVPQKYSHFASAVGNNRSYVANGKLLGGTGMLNIMQYVRGNKHDYDEWKRRGCDGWGYEDVLPYFLKSEDILINELKDSKYHHKGGPLAVDRYASSPLAQRFVDAGKELGYSEVDYNGESQIGFGRGQINVRNGERSSTAGDFLRPAMHRKNLHVAVNAHVTKLLLEGTSVAGVYFIKDGRKQLVRVKREVILSAGTIASPQILMLSGIGPASHLEALHIPVIKDLPVGQNLKDHLIIRVDTGINTTEAITPAKARSLMTLLEYFIFKSGHLASTLVQGLAFLKTDDALLYPDLELEMLVARSLLTEPERNYSSDGKDGKSGGVEGLSLFPMLLHPRSTGQITLQSTDPFDYPLIDPQYLRDAKDVKTFIEAMKIVEKILQTTPYKEIGVDVNCLRTPMCLEHEFRSDAYYECYARHWAVSGFHHSSTCKMGRVDDPTAVVDPQLRVKGIKGLRVVDSSVMPSTVSGNTNAAAIMIAEKASDMIRGKNTVEELKFKPV